MGWVRKERWRKGSSERIVCVDAAHGGDEHALIRIGGWCVWYSAIFVFPGVVAEGMQGKTGAAPVAYLHT
jgi:hypothetical protein